MIQKSTSQTGWPRALARVLFPPSCVHCRGLVEDDSGYRHLCRRCGQSVCIVAAPHCTTCGHPYFGVIEGERTCVHCALLEPRFREGRTAALLRGAPRSLLLSLKYHEGLHVLDDIEMIFGRATELLEFARGATLVPVPLHPRKQRERGYNQSEQIALRLARAAGGVTKVESLLRRAVDTQSQTAFDRRTRSLNLKNAFALAGGGALNPSLHYILVDDVFTTGSTLNSCAGVLRSAGCLNVDVATFAHG